MAQQQQSVFAPWYCTVNWKSQYRTCRVSSKQRQQQMHGVVYVTFYQKSANQRRQWLSPELFQVNVSQSELFNRTIFSNLSTN